MWPAENAYGVRKRLEFCAQVIETLRPRLVLDIGCGTGDNLTRPLAKRFPDVQFIGIDSDTHSIEYARSRPGLPNLTFGGAALANDKRAELVIASEVVEHVEEPEVFLTGLRKLLLPEGRMIVTLPNGRGPFEWASCIEILLRLTWIFQFLRAIKRAFTVSRGAEVERGTLAVSPHINFFSHGQIRAVFAAAGLTAERYAARTFLCGFGFDHLVRGPGLIAWNARVADRLPADFTSAWMFVLREAEPQTVPKYRRGVVARWRRSLNERYWGINGSEDCCR